MSTLRLTRQHSLFMVVAAGFLAIEAVARSWGGPPPSLALVRYPFASIAAATVFCRYVIADRRGGTRRWIIYLSPLTYVLALVFEGRTAPMLLLQLDMLCALGVLGVAGFLVAAVRADAPESRERFIHGLANALVIPMAAAMASFGLWSTHGVNPVYDGRVYAFEEILGVKFSILGVLSYHLIPSLSRLATGCYGILPLALALVAAGQERSRGEDQVLTAMVVAGASGFALYFFCPVVGPLQAFQPEYPASLPAITATAPLIVAPFGAPRNGMPSLHTAWALLLLFNQRPLNAIGRWGLRLFVALTLWAVIGLDDTHWFLDMVVAVPFTVAIQLACVVSCVRSPSRRWVDVMLCSALTLIWLVGLRTAFPLLALPPVAAWTVVVMTVWWPLTRLANVGRAVGTARIPIRETALDSLPA